MTYSQFKEIVIKEMYIQEEDYYNLKLIEEVGLLTKTIKDISYYNLAFSDEKYNLIKRLNAVLWCIVELCKIYDLDDLEHFIYYREHTKKDNIIPVIIKLPFYMHEFFNCGYAIKKENLNEFLFKIEDIMYDFNLSMKEVLSINVVY